MLQSRLSAFCATLLYLISIAAVGIAAADTYSVTNTSDAGDGSLRKAITDANAHNGPDSIIFSNNLSIPVPSALPPLTDLTGGTDINGGGTVKINGNNGSGLSGFDLQSNGNTIRGLTIVRFSGGSAVIIEGDNNIVTGCLIGTDGIGTNNGNAVGIAITGDNNRIGGPNASDRNVLSDCFNGIQDEATDGTIIQGNYVGTDVTGALILGNTQHGILLVGSSDALIGGTSPGEGNVCSGNTQFGVEIIGAGTNVLVQGNFLGTDATGTTAVANGTGGIEVRDHLDVTIGGTTPGARNIISGNQYHGIQMQLGTGDYAVIVQGNYIGLDVTGTAALPNGEHGIFASGSVGAQIGGTVPAARNVISGNAVAGIDLESSSDNWVIQGNYFGSNAAGTASVPNTWGIQIKNSDGTQIGGTDPGAGNFLSGNTAGILLNTVANTIVQGNTIGSNLAGTAAFDVLQTWGLNITMSTGTLVGGSAAAASNIIAYNSEGIRLNGNDTNTFRHNSIFGNTSLAIDRQNGTNADIAAPIVTAFDPPAGTAPSNAIVELYVDSGAQAKTYVGVAQSNIFGSWSAAGVNLAAYNGKNLTAIATDTNGNTSAVSAPLAITGLVGGTHTADQDANNSISLSELLRVIQFYNIGSFGCMVGTEDGYAPNAADHSCAPHDSDYAPQDWSISLSELLRVIQFYNIGAYHVCPADGTEDGFCPGL